MNQSFINSCHKLYQPRNKCFLSLNIIFMPMSFFLRKRYMYYLWKILSLFGFCLFILNFLYFFYPTLISTFTPQSTYLHMQYKHFISSSYIFFCICLVLMFLQIFLHLQDLLLSKMKTSLL